MRSILIAVLAAAPFSIAGRSALSQIVIAPNPFSLQFVQTVRQNQDAWKQLGAEASDIVSPKLTGVEVTVSCGRYTELEASFSNGSVESKEVPGDEPTQIRLGKLFALNSAIVRIVEQPCME